MTPCRTPNAIYHSNITGNTISMNVELPFELDLTETEAIELELELHRAVENVLAQFFK